MTLQCLTYRKSDGIVVLAQREHNIRKHPWDIPALKTLEQPLDQVMIVGMKYNPPTHDTVSLVYVWRQAPLAAS